MRLSLLKRVNEIMKKRSLKMLSTMLLANNKESEKEKRKKNHVSTVILIESKDFR
jgi:hypothetical protein